MDKELEKLLSEETATHKELNEHLEHGSKVFKNARVKEAFQRVDRKDFVIGDYRVEAHEDYALPLLEGQTISQPTTVAFMLELLNPQEGDLVLDVGSGSGWTTALLAHIVGEKGSVLGVERVKELVLFGEKNLSKYNFKNVSIKGSVGTGDKESAPYDRILVSAAFKEEIPSELIDQLKPGGVLVAPVDESIVRLEKDINGKTKTKVYQGFVFVPFIYDKK